ncbi:GDP-mannose 4,6-dehydratase [bacterium]|nr:GDP-mannose 4,6-dehydratase [candidate division CSSED10-310 bacterium]
MIKTRQSVLVTGAAGLLGSHMADVLLHRGYKVTGIDNLSIGCFENLSQANTSDHFTFYQMDVKDNESLMQLPRHDAIIHMAAYKIEIPGLKGIDILETNSFGTASMLRMANLWKSRFLFASTSDVYGRSEQIPFQESGDLVLGSSDIPRWGYAASKIFDEHLCFAHQREYHQPITVIRYFNTYGPRHELSPRSGGPQALFFDALLRGKEMVVHGDGTQQRCFAYVSDAIEMTVRALECDEAIGEIINIGNPYEEISIKDLAQMAFEVFGGKGSAPIRFVDHHEIYQTKKFQEVSRRIPDISKALKLLGFKPKISQREGLYRTLEWQKSLDCYNVN